MAILHPFRALRPVPERAEEVACVPYDVVNTQEARDLAQGKPLNFLHVIRPEIDLPEGTDEHADEVYARGAENLKAYAASATSLQEEEPSVYVYRLVMDGRAQTGIFGCVAVSEYDDDTILKHEKTRPAKEEDRTRHILAQQAHAEPVMLTYRDDENLDMLVTSETLNPPLYDFTAPDGVRHTIWRVTSTSEVVGAFQHIEKLYVADGHHRCKAASRAAAALRDKGQGDGEAEFAFFPAVLFPMGQMHIMAYNRIVRRLPMAPDAFLDRLASQVELRRNTEQAQPEDPGQVCIYLDGHWHTLVLPPSGREAVADQLDVARLSEFVLEPLLGIQDPRTDPNIDFVGGIRGAEELVRLVDSGRAALAFSMYPTSVEELVAVSDAGQLMPPKSTWFEPKLRSGLLVHLFS